MKVIDLLVKIANGEIKDGTIFEVLGDFFYKLIVIDENLYCINTYSKQLQLVENKYIGRFINKEYEIVEIGNKIKDIPKEDNKIEKLKLINDYVSIDFTKDKISYCAGFEDVVNKINEIIDRLNGKDDE